MEENKGETDIYTIVVVVVSVLIIIVLAYLFYYFASKSASLAVVGVASVSGKQNISLTKVISFKPSEVSPKDVRNGNCWVSSIAEPFREDAFRCAVGDEIYDPCFKTLKEGFVFCQMNPLVPEAFLIKLTKPLPSFDAPKNKQSNWAWFVKLKDGIYCSPFTGTRPVFEEDKIAYYGCVSNDKNEQIVLIGDLLSGSVWTGDEAIFQKNGQSWILKSLMKAEINTVWQ